MKLALPILPRRDPDSHKGDYGKALIVAGSRGMAGAAVLAGMACLRGGAGLVTVACPDRIADTVAAGFPCYTTLPLPCDDRGVLTYAAASMIENLPGSRDALAIGPGLRNEDAIAMIVTRLWRNPELPMVLDADALNVLSPFAMPARPAPTVLTPHPGEFQRLTGKPLVNTATDRLEQAMAFAKQHQLVLLLKGHRSIITDGKRHAINQTGNAGMATGGSGDVLTGLICALLAQGMNAFEAATLGAHLHGHAGDLAAADLGEASLTALDLVHYLPKAFKEHTT